MDGTNMLSWQDKFRKERIEKNDLLQKVTKLEHALSMSRVNCRQLEAEVKNSTRSSSNHNNNNVVVVDKEEGQFRNTKSKSRGSFRKEEEDFIQELRSRNESLQQEQKRLQSRLKGAAIMVKKLKQQLSSLKLRSANGIHTANSSSRNMRNMNVHPTRPRSASKKVMRSRSDGDVMMTTTTHPRNLNVPSSTSDGCKVSVGGYRGVGTCSSTFLEGEADVDVGDDQMYRRDTDTAHVLSSLQQRLLGADHEIKRLKEENNHLLRIHTSSQNRYNNTNSMSTSAGNTYFNVQTGTELTQNSVEELQSKLKMLEVQYNTLESTSHVQLQVHKQTRTKLEDCNTYIRKLRQELNQVRREKEEVNRNNIEVEEREEQLRELMEENKMLEERLAKLCDLPFAQDGSTSADDEEEHRHHIALVVKEYESEIEHHKRQVDVLSRDNMNYERSASALREENDDLKEQCSKLESNMGQLRSELETYVHERRKSTQRVSIYTQVDMKCTEKEGGVVDASCQTKSTVSDLIERNEMNDTLHRHDIIVEQLNDKINALQIVSSDRLKRVRSLEERLVHIGSVGDMDRGRHSINGDCTLSDGLLQAATDKITTRVMMVKILACKLTSSTISTYTNTLIVVDLLGFEMRGSTMASGNNPNHQFEATYELKIDAFMLQQLETRDISFEVYKVEGSSTYELYGHGSIKLHDIFEFGLSVDEYKNEQRVQITAPTSSKTEPSQIGFIDVYIKLATSRKNHDPTIDMDLSIKHEEEKSCDRKLLSLGLEKELSTTSSR